VEGQSLMPFGELVALFLYFTMLSFLAVGGAPSVLPEMHRYVVDVNGWMTSAQFAEIFALAQVAPGPNVMYVPLIGWRVAGWAGMVALTLSVIIPSCTVTWFIAHLHSRHGQSAFALAIRRGLTPLTIGFIFASGWILLPAVNADWRGYALTVITVAIVLRTSWSPLWLLGLGAVAGMAGWV
jgi:chromate transporter